MITVIHVRWYVYKDDFRKRKTIYAEFELAHLCVGQHVHILFHCENDRIHDISHCVRLVGYTLVEIN